jgi:hypothetical protein
MTRLLRQGKGRNGLILANGGVMTYQHVVILSTMRRPGGSAYPQDDPLPEFVTGVSVPQIEAVVRGGEQDAVVEVCSHSGDWQNMTMTILIHNRLISLLRHLVCKNVLANRLSTDLYG